MKGSGNEAISLGESRWIHPSNHPFEVTFHPESAQLRWQKHCHKKFLRSRYLNGTIQHVGPWDPVSRFHGFPQCASIWSPLVSLQLWWPSASVVKNAARLAGPLQRIRREAYPGVRLQTSLKEKQRIILLSALVPLCGALLRLFLDVREGNPNWDPSCNRCPAKVSRISSSDSHQSQLLVIDAYPRSSSSKSICQMWNGIQLCTHFWMQVCPLQICSTHPFLVQRCPTPQLDPGMPYPMWILTSPSTSMSTEAVPNDLHEAVPNAKTKRFTRGGTERKDETIYTRRYRTQRRNDLQTRHIHALIYL